LDPNDLQRNLSQILTSMHFKGINKSFEF
jgi:hypothetical protein